ncbi:MAG: hypothetical protein IJV50_04885 [Lachnospiraceae bacterium]|nr:hypothetical protein [Lachnospiraceae bacterium]
MKETTIVLNTIDSTCGEILERTRSHLIRKNEDGRIFGEFVSLSIEESAVKLTFTGLKSFAQFEIVYYTLENERKEECRKANSAGVLEFKIIISEGGKVTVEEMR